MDPMLQFVILLIGEIVFNFIAVYLGYLIGKIPLRPAFTTLEKALSEARQIRTEVGIQVPALEQRFTTRLGDLHTKIDAIRIPDMPKVPTVEEISGAVKVPSLEEIGEYVDRSIKRHVEVLDVRISALEKSLTVERGKVPTTEDIMKQIRPELGKIHEQLMEELRLSERRVRDDMNKQISDIGDRLSSRIEDRIVAKIDEKVDTAFEDKLKIVDKMLEGNKGQGSFTDRLMSYIGDRAVSRKK